MSDKNFMSYGDAETVLSEYAEAIKALDPEGGTLDTRLSAVEDVIPSEASASNPLATISDVDGLLNALSTTKFTSDLNACIEAGVHVFNQSTANRPDYVNWGCILVFGVNTKDDNNKYIYQLLFPTTGETKFRYSINSTTQIPTNWTSWQDIIKTSDLTSTVTQGSGAPITSGGVYSELNQKAEKETYWVWNNQTTFSINLEDISNQRIGNRCPVLLSVLSTAGDSQSPKTHLFSLGIIATASAPVSIISVGGDGGFTASVSGWTVTITCPQPYNNAKIVF